MKNIYELKIYAKYQNHQAIIEILDGLFFESTEDELIFTVVEDEDDNYYDFINNFLDILEGKYENLLELNVTKKDITFWFIYEFYGQCNLEFNHERMKRIGEVRIVVKRIVKERVGVK